jgi:hypothetical protein
VGVLLLASPSLGANWLKNCQGTSSSTANTINLAPGGFACTRPTTETENSGTAFAGACENVDVIFFADYDGDGTDTTITATVENCGSKNAGDSTPDTDMCHTVEGVTLTGANPTEAINGAKLGWFYINAGGTTPTGSDDDDVEIQVWCNGPSQ